MDSQAAQDEYRAAWMAHRETTDDGERQRLEDLMDSLQPSICDRPSDPIWIAFRASLPGFEAHFGNMVKTAVRSMMERVRTAADAPLVDPHRTTTPAPGATR